MAVASRPLQRRLAETNFNFLASKPAYDGWNEFVGLGALSAGAVGLAACGIRLRLRKIGIVEFEFDSQKSEINKEKHGIDFIEAQLLWKSKHILLGAKDAFEKRYLVVGTIGREHWSAIITIAEPGFGLLV